MSILTGRAGFGCSSTGAINYQKLLLHEETVSDDGPRATGSEQFSDRGQ